MSTYQYKGLGVDEVIKINGERLIQEIALWCIGRCIKLTNLLIIELANSYVKYWQKNPNRGLTDWLELNHEEIIAKIPKDPFQEISDS